MQIDRLGSFAFFVRLDLEGHALAFVQGIQARAFDRADMHENITPAIIRFYKPITPLRVKEFDCSLLRHGTYPSQYIICLVWQRRGRALFHPGSNSLLKGLRRELNQSKNMGRPRALA